MFALRCHAYRFLDFVDEDEYHRVAREVCRGNYVPLKTRSGSQTTYVRGQDGFRCPKCGGVMFLKTGR